MSPRVGQARRRDSVEASIIEALRVVGCQVWAVSGKGVFDIIALRDGQYFPMEVKGKDGKLTPAQRDIPWPVVRSIDEAFNVINKIRKK